MQEEPGLKGVVVPLKEAHAVLWKALNSFAHAGIHALNRVEYGFPEALAYQLFARHSYVGTFFDACLRVDRDTKVAGPHTLK